MVGGKPAFPASKKGKRGGQSGHSGKTLEMVEAADTIHVLKPGVCQGCQQVIGLNTPMIFLGKRQVFDLPAIQLEVTGYQHFGCTCTAVLAFAKHTDVPFTNNLAERDVRPAKSKIKVAGCFRTIQGAQAYARIHSFISTVRKHQYNPFNELINIFSGLTPQYRAATT